MDVVPYKAEHLIAIALQERQQYLGPFIDEALAETLEVDGWSWTGIQDGEVLACSGVQMIWKDRGLAWAYLSEHAGAHFLNIHRAVKNFLDTCGVRRVEMTVDCRFHQAHRWAGMLGFQMEAGRLKAYTPNGDDVSLYARVR